MIYVGHDPLLEQQMYELAGKVSTDWHELATCLGVSDELVVSVRRDIHTTREQAWVMLTHYASTVKKENINDTVCSVLAEIRSKNIRKKRGTGSRLINLHIVICVMSVYVGSERSVPAVYLLFLTCNFGNDILACRVSSQD